MHYKRAHRHGCASIVKIRHGASRDFVEAAIAAETDECINFPFGRVEFGYGRINVDGLVQNAHAYVAKRVYGPKPSEDYVACHSCGKGNEGCINPRHIRWGTRSDNVQDAIRHGTHYYFPVRRGRDIATAKLSGGDIDIIRDMFRAGASGVSISREFNISQSQVSRIRRGQAWAPAEAEY